MGKVTGFLEIDRQDRRYAPASDRVRHFKEFVLPLDPDSVSRQGARCMDCGIPFCHQGCPVNNIIPDWNDLVYKGEWRAALDVLHSTNNFPEFTGRVCPAPCEESCTLNIDNSPVTIKTIECTIIDTGWKEGWVAPVLADKKTGKRVAVIGSGPSGLACAQQLARVGHDVVVFEKNDAPGGLLRYGIPDFLSAGMGATHPSFQPVSMIEHSMVLIVTGLLSILSVQDSSHGAGQTRPVNSGKLLVECKTSSAARHSPL